MASSVPWLAVGALAAGVASLAFARYLWPYRNEPGGLFFVATIACETLWTLSYGVALLVFDPGLRRLFEVPVWLSVNFIGVFFLAFALDYTGRGELVRSKAFGAIVAVQTVHTGVVLTNPVHGVAWQNYHVDPVFGAATVAYSHGPWLYLNAAGVILLIAAASFILLDTFLSYGPLYRTQAAAVAVSPVLPGVAFLLWLGEGAVFPLNLTPYTFPLHLAIDGYAFFSRNMFEMTPAARRVGERSAIDDLGTAVVTLDDAGRVVDLNREAERVLGTDEAAVLGGPPPAPLQEVDPAAPGGPVSTTVGGERRKYAVTGSPVRGSTGVVGHTVVLQDVTEARRREQRLAVLNRVLRHNLRNDLNVVQGNLNIAAERTDDGEVADLLAAAETSALDLMELGEKAREIERAMGARDRRRPVPVRELVEATAADLHAGGLGGDVRTDVPADLRVRANELLLRGVFENLVENGLEHSDSDDPVVEVTFTGLDGDRATFHVRDDGPGIPDHELDALAAEEETALEHGSGLGLWFVAWGVASLGGDIAFETGPEGTVAVVTLPDASRASDAGR